MLGSIWQIKWELQSLLMLALVLLALWRGAPPERWVALVFIGMLALDRTYHAILGPGLLYHDVNIGHVLIDGAAVVAFGAIGLRANRVYPLWLTGLQLMAAVSHVARALSPAIASKAYEILMIAPSYLQIAVFALGLLLHLVRRANFGPYRSWRHS